ncbi:hypothetical protein, partial [Methylibium sp.]|uniref:hypothetical protein n=1 Tax=Methylibium sp. TaxID=2067992 RepID=UPI0018281752
MARLSEPSLILAIGLLNYADDEGYFNANEALIKAAVFPLREPSLSVQRMLSELVDIGYVRIGITEDGRRVGIVVHFRDHQKISHAQPSRLKHLVKFTTESLNVPTDVTERSVNVPEKSRNVPENPALIRDQGTGIREGKGALPHTEEEGSADFDSPRQALPLTDAQRLGWLKRKRAWVSAPSDEAAWLGMLKDFGPQAVDTAIEHLRRANPAKKYVDAGDVQ